MFALFCLGPTKQERKEEKIKIRVLFLAVVLLLVLSGSAQATLYVRGMGTIISSGVGSGGEYQLIYDDLLDITWLDYTYFSVRPPDATSWASDLEILFNGETSNNWRLPQTLPVNGSTYVYDVPSYDGSSDRGYNISAPGTIYEGSTGSEMAHLHYYTLGNPGEFDVYGNGPAWDPDAFNSGPFSWVTVGGRGWYVSETWFDDMGWRYWGFRFDGGYQITVHWTSRAAAMAVHPGDVGAPIPEPTTWLLLGSGLIGLAGFRRKFKKR